MRVKFWGVRGSIPVPGKSTIRTGGNTLCVQVVLPWDGLVILDAGSGIRELGRTLVSSPEAPLKVDIFISHTHWDHIQGFPFFAPAFSPHNTLTFHGPKQVGHRLSHALEGQMNHMYFPIDLNELAAKVQLVELREGRTALGNGLEVLSQELTHPGGVYAYRFSAEGRTLVYATDVEQPSDSLDERLINLAAGAHLLIMDATYTEAEYEGSKEGWGHSTNLQAASVAKEAGVKQVALFHHDPAHDDDFLEAMEKEAQAVFSGAILAREGLEIEL